MVRHHEEIDGADAIARAHQVEFLVPREVTHVRHAELAERNHAPH
jgi:hypothetical protein